MAIRKVVKNEAEVQSELLQALRHVSEEKGIPVEALVASIEGALVSAYKKAYGGTGAVRVAANLETNEFHVFAQKRVVQSAMNTNTEIAWREARNYNPTINLGDEVEQEVTPSGFGRIAAQTAKQVLLQKLREAERVQVVSEYADKFGEMFNGVVQRIERGNIIMQIGKAEAVMPKREQTPGENYRFNDTYAVYVVDVRQNYKGPSITVSRTHPGLVKQLFAREVPEIIDGIVEIKAVAREAGQRTKIAVAATNPDVDPVGACVGPRGMRVGKVVNELGNEKVDIVRWNADPILYITNALSPAQISKVLLMEDKDGTGTATVIVAEDQQSLAIGKQGQNVRLAAKLTNWRIDIRTEKQYAEEQAKRMFSVDDDLAPVKSVTRESEDELSKLFSTDEPGGADNNQDAEAQSKGDETVHGSPGGAVTETGSTDAGEETDAGTDEGTNAPIADVEIPGEPFQIDSAPDVPAGDDGERGHEDSNGVSTLAPADSVQA